MVSEKIRVAPICRKQAARSQAKACDGQPGRGRKSEANGGQNIAAGQKPEAWRWKHQTNTEGRERAD